MKHFIILTTLSFFGYFTSAQKIIEKHLPVSPDQSIKLNIQIADSIRIIGWDKNEVYPKASVNINDNKDNDVYIVKFEEKSNLVSVDARFENKENLPSKDSCNCCNYKSKIYWDIYVPAQATVTVETINGNITIEGNTKNINAHSISGFIDMKLVASRKADLKMSTITGTIYSDLSINYNANRKRGNAILFAYNGGGEKVELETISGDIFLRKY